MSFFNVCVVAALVVLGARVAALRATQHLHDDIRNPLMDVDEAIKILRYHGRDAHRGRECGLLLAGAIERVRDQAAMWIAEQKTYPDTPEGRHAAAALRCCSREVLAAVNGGTS